MKNIKLLLALMLILVVSGCVAGSKAVVKPSAGEICKPMPPVVEKEILPETPAEPTVEKIEEKDIAKTQAVVDIKPVESARISYSQIVSMLDEFIDIKENGVTSEGNNYFGTSESKLVVLEIKGNKDDVKEASMKIIYPKGIAKANVELNNAMMSRFLKNAAPEYQDWRVKIDETLNKFNSMTDGASGEDIKSRNKTIQILCNRNADCIEVTLKIQP